MPKKKETLTINFLSETSFESSKAGKVITWVLTIGKVIVFITFLVVMGGFIYRFTLDKRIESLNEEIETNVEAIQEYSDIEFRIRKVQSKLDKIETLTTTGSQDMVPVFRKIENNLPLGTQLESIDLRSNTVTFKGTTLNEKLFAALLAALKKQPEFGEITIDELQSGGVANPEITFSVKIVLNEETTETN